MEGKRRAKWALMAVGVVLFVGAYALGYLLCRQGHYLVHRVSGTGDEQFHSVTTGDPGNFAGWWAFVTHEVPYVIFTPLRWLETAWWELRDE